MHTGLHVHVHVHVHAFPLPSISLLTKGFTLALIYRYTSLLLINFFNSRELVGSPGYNNKDTLKYKKITKFN